MSAPARHDLRALAARGSIHFMGVGGAGMVALAELLARRGAAVTGCDVKRTPAFDDLERLGVRTTPGTTPVTSTGPWPWW